MDSPSDMPNQPVPTAPNTDTPAPQTPTIGRQLGPWLERVQGYLAPLEPLGKRRAAWIGAALLALGVFLPAKAASIPFLDTTITASFWDFSKTESFLLIICALVSAGVAYVRDYKWLWATGVAALFFLVIEFFNALTQSYIHPSWGWIILFPAALLLLIAAAMRPNPSEAPGNALATLRDLSARMSSR